MTSNENGPRRCHAEGREKAHKTSEAQTRVVELYSDHQCAEWANGPVIHVTDCGHDPEVGQ